MTPSKMTTMPAPNLIPRLQSQVVQIVAKTHLAERNIMLQHQRPERIPQQLDGQRHRGPTTNKVHMRNSLSAPRRDLTAHSADAQRSDTALDELSLAESRDMFEELKIAVGPEAFSHLANLTMEFRSTSAEELENDYFPYLQQSGLNQYL
ncbi:hypothetical protein BDV96DRAFT_592307 [Lophiotrema nucula]|uniref:Uncharacterized protein n=1 Tax=Lophiotrema nucula TaxID=690887 RepID=A0A6A5YF87_9PLEO|nr:hypothetical protein BDV96DRAFT_592307 [Lophiotrema nucula]